jgi:uncharacterized protein (TIGR04255 family)
VALSGFKIDVGESFETLPHAPIVEAVIEIRARAEAPWQESTISEELKSKLPDYPIIGSQSAFRQEVRFSSGQPPETKQEDLGWKGLRFQTENGLQVVQFNRDGFVFSRLQPYENWERFHNEALRLWGFHSSLAHITEIQRLGLRFINRITMSVRETALEDYIQPHAPPPQGLDLPLFNFFHLDQLAVPGYPYAINIARTLQLPRDPELEGFGILLDIDVFSERQFELRQELLLSRLSEMRWLKNKAFFGSVTKRALETFR